jgi:hypothetical protein
MAALMPGTRLAGSRPIRVIFAAAHRERNIMP